MNYIINGLQQNLKKNQKKLNDTLTKKEKEYLQNRKQVTMCVDPNWMPLEKIERGKHIGLAADYVKIVEDEIGIDIKLIKTKHWDQSIQKAQNKECDIFTMVPNVKKYSGYMNFTSPFVEIPMVIATQTDVQFIDNIQQIIDKKIAIVRNFSTSDILQKRYPNIIIVDVKSVNDGLIQVESGKVFAFIDNLATVNYEIQKSFIDTIKVSGRLDIRPKYGMAIRDDEPILYNIFEKVIANIDPNKKEKIFHKWVNLPIKEKVVDYTIIGYILIVVVILIALFLFRQYSLKKRNRDLQIAVENKTKALKELNESLELKVQEELAKNNKIQEQLFKSEKMASMGEMIGNISHQWRQPLSVISTASTGIIMEEEYGVLDKSKLIKTCTIINNNAQYLSKTIDDFTNFIKGDRVKKVFSLQADIDSFLNLVEGSIKTHNINIILDIQKDITIDGYENELTQCLMNIFNNAKDALKENINTPKIRYLFITAFKEENTIVIKLKDNGGGMPQTMLRKIFEPYFTTKHKSLGTGLGLHMTYILIVDGMGGTIEAVNRKYQHEGTEYQGAEFVVKLPVS
jgi:signal transduction histidine kinase